MNSAIVATGIGKKFALGQLHGRADGLRHAIESAVRAPARWLREGTRPAKKLAIGEFWALQDVSFAIDRGEAVGIVGRNGAGKSTLLKILSRITEPTCGEIRYKGRLASLLEVGTGFHPELTGRENIYMNAAILGMRRSEINRRFDEIVAFSEVEQFLDTPVKRYSSGMYVRLAFSVAAHLDPDILIVDEVLAVGDAAFQKKCLTRMSDVVHEGRTVLFVSHNMAAVSALCARAIVLRGGRITFSGKPRAAIEEYLRTVRADADTQVAARADRKGDGRMRFSSVELLDDQGSPIATACSGQDVALRLNYELPDGKPLQNAAVQIKFEGNMGQPLFACMSEASRAEMLTLTPGGSLICRIPRLPLMPGLYTYTIWCRAGGEIADYVRDAGKMSVAEGDFFGTGKLPSTDVGDFAVLHAWESR